MGLGEEARAGAFAPKEPEAHEPDESKEPAVVQTEEERVALAEQQRIAEFNAHPHTQITALLKELSAPRHDIHDRLGAVHNGLIRMAQLVLQHTPVPENPNG